MRKNFSRREIILAGIVSLSVVNPLSADTIIPTPAISIIIDDIGYRHRDDIRAMALPGSVAYAIMPHSPHARKMSRLATLQGKVVLLHLPMQAIEDKKNRFLGPGALKLDMTHKQFIHTLEINLRSLPEAIGVNNHMGSLLSQNTSQMKWLMEELNQNNKFYIDSLTSHRSIASKVAEEKNVPYLRRDVFLDNQRNEDYIQKQFEELIKLAKRKGKAVAIGHPHPETIQVLAKNLQRLDTYGVRLISVMDMVNN